jgi:tetratricopeptide (TPR) repeat protein
MKRVLVPFAWSRRQLQWALALATGAIALGSACGWIAERGTSPSARLELARDLAFDRKPEEALKQVRHALATLGPAGDSRLRLQGLTRAAQITDAQLGPAHANEALAWYGQIVRDFPSTPEAYDAGVRISEILHTRFGDDLHSEQQLVAVVNAFPRQAGVERLLLHAARSAADGQRYEDAEADAKRLLKDYPTSELAPDAQLLLAEVLHLESRHPEAVAAYQVVADRWPRTAMAARALEGEGRCLAELGDLSRSMGKYIEALADHPDPMSVQRSLERVRRRFTALRAVEPGSKAYAFGNRSFEREQ